MGIFKNMKSENLEDRGDQLGGSAFDAVPSDVYDATIQMAYVGKSASSDAQSVTLLLDLEGKELRHTVWMTDGKGNNFYVGKDDNKKYPLPGFTTINDICLLVTGEELAEQDTETKTAKVYDFEARKEIAKDVQCITALHGGKVKLGILRKIVDKQKKGDDNKYHNTGETRTENEIDKVFHADTGRTVNEYRHEIDPGEFLGAWLEKNKGKDRNQAKGLSGAGTGQSGEGRPTAKKKLFG